MVRSTQKGTQQNGAFAARTGRDKRGEKWALKAGHEQHPSNMNALVRDITGGAYSRAMTAALHEAGLQLQSIRQLTPAR